MAGWPARANTIPPLAMSELGLIQARIVSSSVLMFNAGAVTQEFAVPAVVASALFDSSNSVKPSEGRGPVVPVAPLAAATP